MKIPPPQKTLSILCGLAMLGQLAPATSSAQTYIWSEAAGGEWTNTANWDPSTNYARNIAGVTALFGDFAGVGNNIAVTMASVTTLGAQTVSFSGDDNYTLGATSEAGKLRLAGTTQLVSATGSGVNTINSPLTFGIQSSSSNVVATISNASSGVLTINRLEGVGSGGADHQLVVTGSGNTVLSTGVFNPGAQVFSVDVVKSGTGTLTFSSNPGAAINQGITIDGGGVVLGAASTHTGGTTVNSGGRLVIGAANAISATGLVLNNGGTLQLGNGGSGSVTDAITNNGTVTFNFATGTTVTNVISGSGRVVHEQGQRVSLSGANSYSGGTRIASGGGDDVILGVSSDGNLGDASGGLTLAGTGRGTLRLDGPAFSSARSIVLEGSGGRLAVGSAGDTALFSGSITGGGGLTAGIASGAGGNTSGIITLSGALSYSGPTAVAFGSLVLSNAAGTTNALTGGFTGSGALIKDGAGVLEVAGGNSATGLLTVRGGTVRTAGATDLYGANNITMTNASVLEATESFTLSRRLIMGSGTGGTNSVGVVNVAADKELTLNAGGGGVGGVGQMVKTGSGTLILASSNNINNGTSTAILLEAGKLVVTNTGTLGNQGANVFFAMNGGALDLGTTTQVVGGFTVNEGTVSNGTVSNSGNYNMSSGIVSAALTGSSANLNKTGSGTLTLSGNNTYAGTTTVSAGSLIVNGNQSAATGVLSVASGATLGGSGTIGGATIISGTHSPGNSPGVQTFGSDLTYSGTPTVQWELTANTTTQASPTPVFDQIIVGGNLDFAVPTTLTLNFALAESGVNWSNGLWANNISGTSGWLLYDVAGTLSNFQNLAIAVDNWADGDGLLLQSVRTGSAFSLYQEGNDIYLNYAVPEPSTYALIALAASLVGIYSVRRRNSMRSRVGR